VSDVIFLAPAVDLIFPVEFKRHIVKPCADAWAQAGEHGKESSCYTKCEAVMYQCHDDAFAAKYDAYQVPAVEAASFVVFKRQIVMPCAYGCAKAGDQGSESSCYTKCEAEMLRCRGLNHIADTAEVGVRHGDAVAKYEIFLAPAVEPIFPVGSSVRR